MVTSFQSNVRSKEHGTRLSLKNMEKQGWRDGQLETLAAALPEDQGLVSSTHVATHSYL